MSEVICERAKVLRNRCANMSLHDSAESKPTFNVFAFPLAWAARLASGWGTRIVAVTADNNDVIVSELGSCSCSSAETSRIIQGTQPTPLV